MSAKEKKTTKKPKINKKRTGDSSVHALEKNIEKLTMDLNDLNDKYIRLQAEFDNFRKRKEKEIIHLIRYEGEDVIKNLLTIFDDFDRMKKSVEHPDQKKSFEAIQEGVAMIEKKLNKFFQDKDIQPFGQIGKILDSDIHDALMVRTEKGKKNHEILEVFEKGYMYKDRIIRHAKVVVNKI